MADGIDIQLNTRFQDAKWLSGNALGQSLRVEAAALLQAAERAVQPGLVALQSNVNQIRSRKCALRRSPGTKSKLYGGGSRQTATALVGYRSGVAPHAYYVEFGTRKRRGRGAMAARRPLLRAFESARSSMEAAMTRELQAIMARAASKIR